MEKTNTKEGFFEGAGGIQLYFKQWTPSTIKPVGRVLAVHGLGEHINRYDHVFQKFAEEGFVVRGFDNRGHGQTYESRKEKKVAGSIQGHTDKFEYVFGHILKLNEFEVSPEEVDLPTFVFGHSLGGLIALSFVQQNGSNIKNFKGVISQAPAIKPGVPLPGYAKVALSLTGIKAVAQFTDANSLDPEGLCTDQAVRDAYASDTLVHERISLGTLNDILKSAEKLKKGALQYEYSLFIAHSAADKYCAFDGSADFFKAAGSKDKKFERYEDVGHELHNEPSIKEKVIGDYASWMKERI